MRDLAAFQILCRRRPTTPARRRRGRVSSLSLVRYRGNDYSVPTAYGHREVLVRGYVHEVVIACGADIIARHARSYEREDFVFDPLHYLALLEQKIGALDQAAPLVGWDLPEEFAMFRRLLEARMGKPGKREFVQVLRLLETFRRDDVVAGIKEAIARGAIGFDAVKHLVLCRIERRPPRLDLTVYPYLPRATVATTSARSLHGPAQRGGVMTDTPQLLLAHHLKALKLPTFLREYDKLARQCAAEGVDHTRYLLRLAELELIDRERRMVERRIKEAKFPAVKSLDSFDFLALPSLNKALVLELARSEYVARRENIIAVGNSGTGKTHIALGLGLAACQKGLVGRLHHRRRPGPRADRGPRREAAAAPAAPARRLQAADHRRTRLRAALPDRRRAAVRGVHPALRARLHHRHQQPAVRRVDRRVRLRAPDRRAARPADPPRPHPRDERRQLPAQTEQASIAKPSPTKLSRPRHPKPDRQTPERFPSAAFRRRRLMHYCSGPPMHFCSGDGPGLVGADVGPQSADFSLACAASRRSSRDAA